MPGHGILPLYSEQRQDDAEKVCLLDLILVTVPAYLLRLDRQQKTKPALV